MPKAHSKFEYRVNALGANEAELFIYGDIGDNPFRESTNAQDVREELESLHVDTIYVRINSIGGAVKEALAIYNLLRRHTAKKIVTVDGFAYSAASLIAMAGDEIRMAENALMMVHGPAALVFDYLNAKRARELADIMDKYSEALAASYARKTGKDRDEMVALLTDGDDHFYTAPEAVDAGFADSIVEEVIEDLAASFDVSRFLGRAPAKIAASLRPTFIHRGEHAMGKQNEPNNNGGAPAPEPNRPDNVTSIEEARDEARRAALVEMKQRNQQIRRQFGPHMSRPGVADIVNAALDDPAMTVAQVSEQVLAKLGEGAEPISQGPTVEPGADDADKRRDAMAQSLLARMGIGTIEGANPFRGRRLNELARASVEAAGGNVRDLPNDEICAMALGAVRAAGGGQTTSDFPVLLENVMHKLMLEGFNAQPTTWDQIAATGDVSDFREWNRLVPGLMGSLDDVNERGEYKNKNLPDAQKNTNRVKRRGNIIDITPEVLVNDDTGYIQRMTNGLGRIGARAIDKAVYALLESNPTLSDGVGLFHATHKNLGTGAAPSVDAIDKLRVAMAQQTAPGEDAEYLDIRPQIALANTALEGDLRVIIRSAYDPDAANKLQRNNKVYNLVNEIVSSPRLSAKPWYLFADPSVNPVLEVVFLDGQREPRLRIDEAFRTAGVRYRVALDFGVGAIDFRGAQKNPGA